ncbi:MAG: RNA-binding protein [Bacteroidales bacterium]|jgi:RNA recognition motif-containing protein|nr:RNA-binding protein [Bacteroidales bacterium]
MNIFVSNLNYATTDDGLRRAFEECGEVSSAKVITDKFTGRSRGFGFVEMSDDDGQKAIDTLNGTSLDDKIINVAVSQPRERSNNRSFNNRENYGNRNDRNYRNNDRY